MFRRGKFKPTLKPSVSRNDVRTPSRSSTSSATNSIGAVVEGLIKPKAVEPDATSSPADEVSSSATVEERVQEESADGEERIKEESLSTPRSKAESQNAETIIHAKRSMVPKIVNNSEIELSSSTTEQTGNDLEFDITVDIEERTNLSFSDHSISILSSGTNNKEDSNEVTVLKQGVDDGCIIPTKSKTSEELRIVQEDKTVSNDIHLRTTETLKDNTRLEQSGTQVDAVLEDIGQNYKESKSSAVPLPSLKCDEEVQNSDRGRADRDIEDNSVEARAIGSSVEISQEETGKVVVVDHSSKRKTGKKSLKDTNDKSTKEKVAKPRKSHKEEEKANKDITEAGENDKSSQKTAKKSVKPGRKRKGSSDDLGTNSKVKSHKRDGDAKRKSEKLKDEKIPAKPSQNSRKLRIYGPIDECKMTIGDIVYYEKEKPKISHRRSKEVKEDLKSDKAEGANLSLELVEKVIENDAESKSMCSEENEDEVLAPQVMLGEDGSIIVKESSLYIKQTTSKQELSETVYEDEHSNFNPYFRKRCSIRNKWPVSKTLKFYRALSQVGTDFTLMQNIFPQETRRRLKMKFKWEEKINGDLVDRALANRLPLNLGDLLGLEKKSDEETTDT